MDTVLNAILAAVGAGVFSGLVFIINRLVKVLKIIEKVRQNDERRGKQMHALFKSSYCTAKAVRATLEVVSGIRNNGNVKEAIDCMDEGDKVTEDFNAAEAWS